MAYTQADLDAIRKAIRMGVTSVRMGERQTDYRDLTELREIERLAAADVEGTAGRSRFIKTETLRGLD